MTNWGRRKRHKQTDRRLKICKIRHWIDELLEADGDNDEILYGISI